MYTDGSVVIEGNLTVDRGNDNPRLYLSSNNAATYSNRVIDVNSGTIRFYRESGPEGTAVLQTIDAAGNVVISGNLTVNGMITGVAPAFTSSDRKLKRNIEPIKKCI